MMRINENKNVARSGRPTATLVRSSRGATAAATTMARGGSATAHALLGVGGAGLSLLLAAGGCGGERPQPVQGDGETDGVVTTGVDGASADETAEEPPYYCIYNDDNSGFVGVKHQCSLEYDLDISFTVSPPIGPSFQVPLSATGVQTISEDSTYEHPFVMACCTDVTDHRDWPFDDSCSYLHHEACLSDFLEHICNAPGVWLEKAAHEFFGQGAEAIEAAADWFKNHRQDCYDHFWTGPDALSTADLCNSDFDGFFDHTPWEPTETWSYVEPISGVLISQVSNVVIAPRSSLGESVPQAPPSPAESCTLPNGNNGETPPLSSPGPSGFIVSPVAPVPIHVVGPKLGQEAISGSGEVGTDSVLQWYIDSANALEIVRWTLVEASATTAGTSSLRANIDGFKLDLLGSETASVITGGWQISAGAALFNLIATVDGAGSNVQATNATPIQLYTVHGGVDACPTDRVSCLVSRPFAIGYEDAFRQSWALDVPTMTWKP
jgi:hypothetical protein